MPYARTARPGSLPTGLPDVLSRPSGPKIPDGQRAVADRIRRDIDSLHQLQPLVDPQPSHTWHEPAGRIFTPHVMHIGASAA